MCVCMSIFPPPIFKPSAEPLMEDKPVRATRHALLAAHQGPTQTEETCTQIH